MSFYPMPLNFQPERGTKRKILDIPEKQTKERRVKEKRVKEKPDEVDNFFKKILKKEREQQPAPDIIKTESEERKADDVLKREQLSEEEKQRILAAVDNDQQVSLLSITYIKDEYVIGTIYKD